jgi:hypothetical protein
MKKSQVRWFIVSLGVIVLITMCSLVSGTSPILPLFQPAVTVSIHPLDRTATRIIGNATATALARQNPFVGLVYFLFPPRPPPPFPSPVGAPQTLTAFSLTDAANGPDPLEFTATAIILNATASEVAYRAATQQMLTLEALNPIDRTATMFILNATATEVAANYEATRLARGLDPLDLTATAIVLNATETDQPGYHATQQALGTTPTPTLTNHEIEVLRQHWLAELEMAAGFSHSAFDAHLDELVEEVGMIPPNYVRDFHVQPDIARVTYEGSTYVVILAPYISPLMGHTLLIFQVTDDTPVLIPDAVESLCCNMRFDPAYSASDDSFDFADVNGNGYPDIAIYADSGGSGEYGGLVLLEITSDGEITNITPQRIDVSPRYLVDIDDDGIFEIFGNSSYRVPLPGSDTLMTRYYGWDGTAYQDISATLDEMYWPMIGEFWESVAQSNGCLLPSAEMYQMLMDYLARGQLEEGWVRLQPQLRWDLCSVHVWTNDRDDMDDLMEWVEAHLEDEGE